MEATIGSASKSRSVRLAQTFSQMSRIGITLIGKRRGGGSGSYCQSWHVRPADHHAPFWRPDLPVSGTFESSVLPTIAQRALLPVAD